MLSSQLLYQFFPFLICYVPYFCAQQWGYELYSNCQKNTQICFYFLTICNTLLPPASNIDFWYPFYPISDTFQFSIPFPIPFYHHFKSLLTGFCNHFKIPFLLPLGLQQEVPTLWLFSTIATLAYDASYPHLPFLQPCVLRPRALFWTSEWCQKLWNASLI